MLAIVMTIDLDDGSWDTTERASLPAGWRRSLAIAVSLLFLAVTSGSIAPRSLLGAASSFPATISDGFELTADRLYVFTGGRSDTPAVLRAYELPAGRQRWRMTLAERINRVVPIPSAGLLIVQMFSDTGTASVAAIRASTGGVLWRRNDVFIHDQRADSGLLTLSTTGPRTIQMVDIRSGAVRWSHGLASTTGLAVDGSGRLVEQSIDGLTDIFDEDTGRMVVTKRLSPLSPSSPLGGLPVRDLAVIDDRLIVMDSYLGGETISEYALATLTLGWRRTLDKPLSAVIDCAPRLCVSGLDDLTGRTNLAALDPETGASNWRSDAWAVVGPFGPWLLASAATDNKQALLDPPTGQALLDLDLWSPLSPPQSGAPILLIGAQTGRLGVWFATLDENHLRVRPLAWLPDVVPHQCQLVQTGPTYLACGTRQGPVRVWQLRSA